MAVILSYSLLLKKNPAVETLVIDPDMEKETPKLTTKHFVEGEDEFVLKSRHTN